MHPYNKYLIELGSQPLFRGSFAAVTERDPGNEVWLIYSCAQETAKKVLYSAMILASSDVNH